jgi:hypothetical protein
MADYALTEREDVVRRTADNAFIPRDEANYDWLAYQEWLKKKGNTPDPAASMTFEEKK